MLVGPRELPVDGPVLVSDSILKSAVVEGVGREVRQARVHAILNLKTNWTVSYENKPLE